MAKAKNKYMEVFKIFFKSIKLYFMHLDTFLKYLSFPVFGQILGIVLILAITYFYSINLPSLAQNYAIFNNILSALTLLLIATLPAFFLFCKAFYDYLIAMAALNSMANNLSSKKKVDDIKVHDELVRRRAPSYMGLLVVLSFVYLIGLLPPFWIVLALFSVYACLSLQVFTFEENTGPIEAIMRSFKLIKNNFWSTALLLVLISILTYSILPELITWTFDKLGIVSFLSIPFENYLGLLQIDDITALLNQFNIKYSLDIVKVSQDSTQALIAYIVTAFTLPIRAASCTFLYKKYDDEKIEEIRKITKIEGKKSTKRAPKKEST